MKLELISIETDTAPLDGLLYRPEGAPKGCIQMMHGNCANFYSGTQRFMPPVLVRAGYAVLVYNRRGHDILGTLNSRQAIGGALQTVAEAMADNRYAADWLASQGFARPIVCGHSHGGMLAVKHAADTPDTPALIVMSGHGGGAGIMDRLAAAGLMSGAEHAELTARARALVAAGKGDTLMLFPGWWYVATARAFLDYAENLPDTVALAPRLKCRTLYLRGTKEPAQLYPGEAFVANSGGRAEFKLLENCDHFYTGCHEAAGEAIVGFLDRVLTS